MCEAEYKEPVIGTRLFQPHFPPFPFPPSPLHSPHSPMFTVEKLESGLPLLTAPIDGTDSVTVMVFAGAGSRYEKDSERGISHFLEHMFFKGGKKYRDTKAVSAAIDGVGGD